MASSCPDFLSGESGTSEHRPRSIEDVFRPAIEEIRRRRFAAEGYDKNGEQFFPSTGTYVRSAIGLQRFALITVGTAVLAPRCLDPRFPALRVYGVFETEDDARDHSEVVAEYDPTCSLIIVQCNQWFLFPQTEATRDNPRENATRLEQRLSEHYQRRLDEEDLFDRAVRDNVRRPEPKTNTAQWDDEQEETEQAVREVYKRPRRLRAGAEVRGQNAVVLSFLPDETGGECLLKVIGCFETVHDAEEWVQNEGSHDHRNEDLFVTQTCEWIYPNGTVKSDDHTHYRVKELQTIMDAAHRNPKNVKRYKQWKREQDKIREDERKLELANATTATAGGSEEETATAGGSEEETATAGGSEGTETPSDDPLRC